MASFGAKYPFFSPIESEPEGGLPIYKGSPIRIGRLVKADLSVQLASGKLYADDGLAENVEEFVSGEISMDTDDMEDAVASVVYGCKVENKEVVFNTGDDPPAGGLGYIKKLMRRRKVLYKGYYYPLAKASIGNDTAQTKSDSITFGTNSTKFTVFACESGAWRFTQEFQEEQDAVSWIKRKLTNSAAPQAEIPTATPAAGSVASGTAVSLSSATPGAVIYCTTDGTAPSGTSPAYSAPIEITAETTIKAIAAAEGFAVSDVMEARYTIAT